MCFRPRSNGGRSYRNRSLVDKQVLCFNLVVLMLVAVITVAVVNFWFFLDQPKVRIGEGYVMGTTMRTRNGRKVFAFLGVPYAEPPVEDLRFRNPVPKKEWSGTLKADEEGNQCLQFHGDEIVGDENCLTLNIYTPKIKRSNYLPVLVFIHGGGYLTGNSSRYLYGPDYLLDENILLVTLNYRLGPFGFLSTGDAAASGNFGLKDQVLALKWVRRNIRAFGGDRKEITLVGENVGATCADLHSLSDSSKHLFNNYIKHNEVPMPSLAFRFSSSYFDAAKRLGARNNCSINDSYLLVNCLKRLTARELMSTSSVFTRVQELMGTEWGPVVELRTRGAFLTESPISLIDNCQLKNSSFMTGIVPDEAPPILQNLYRNETAYDIFARDPLSFMVELLDNIYFLRSKNIPRIAIKAKQFYLGAEMPREKAQVLRGISQFITDIIVLYPSLFYIKYVTEHCGQKIYVYLLNYRGTLSTLFNPVNCEKLSVGHSDSLVYLFPRNFTYADFNYDFEQMLLARNISDLMVDLWTSFVMTSVPKSDFLKESSLWKPYANSSSFLQIGNTSDAVTTLQTSFFEERMRFVHNMYYYT
ncbi:esterase E4-like [Augochlora pura]